MNLSFSWNWLWVGVAVGTLGFGSLYAQNAEPSTKPVLTSNAVISLPTDAPAAPVANPPLFISGNDMSQAAPPMVPPTASPTAQSVPSPTDAADSQKVSRFNLEADAENPTPTQNQENANAAMDGRFEQKSDSNRSQNAQNVDHTNQEPSLPIEAWTAPSGISRTLSGVMLITLFGLVPALVMMTTSFVRISVVLGMLRQAFGLPQLPPPQVLTSLAVFLTLAIMMPVWTQVYETAVVPYSQSEISSTVATERGIVPIRNFMIRQIDHSENAEDIHLFLDRMPPEESAKITTYEQVPLSVLLPAFLLSELKTAFWIGFRICLPFLVIDLVVAAVLSAMGMLMVPPSTVSIPLKILLFVLADGWRLLAGTLLDTFF
ncbi:MAG: flagellar type III secretion system pore protein FliP [Thermoguttaceae bacterium]|nr:flagellar type III secretion system pore protein FliP [Thermoguttaceae bacterium]